MARCMRGAGCNSADNAKSQESSRVFNYHMHQEENNQILTCCLFRGTLVQQYKQIKMQ